MFTRSLALTYSWCLLTNKCPVLWKYCSTFSCRRRLLSDQRCTGFTAWRSQGIVMKERTSGFMMGNTGGIVNLCISYWATTVSRTHTSAADPQEAFLLRQQRSGTLLSEALSHAGVCCGWSWKPDPFSFKNTVTPPPFPVYRGSGIQ